MESIFEKRLTVTPDYCDASGVRAYVALAARFRPGAHHQIVHQVRALKEIDARVDREPEFTLFRHRAAADAQHLRVLRCDALKNRKRRQRRQRARRVIPPLFAFPAQRRGQCA